LVGTEFAKGTLKKFNTALHSLEDSIEWRFNQKDVNLEEVNHLFITEYEFFLKSIKKMQQHLRKEQLVTMISLLDNLSKRRNRNIKNVFASQQHKNPIRIVLIINSIVFCEPI